MKHGPKTSNRPVPADFLDHAPTASMHSLMARYQTRHSVVARWVKESGVKRLVTKGNPYFPMPDDFRINALTMHRSALMRHYRIGVARVDTWLNKCGLEPVKASVPSAVKMPMPEGFPQIAPYLSQIRLSERYGVSRNVIQRWRDEAGVRTLDPTIAQRQSMLARGFQRPAGTPPTTGVPPRPDTIAAHAQMFLQRYGPVFRASTINPKSPGWIMFGRTVTESEMIQRAERHGFQAVAA